jgi:hypothetical protein
MMRWDTPSYDIDKPDIYADLFNFIVGEFLGEGQFRKVFLMKSDPKVVLKIEKTHSAFHNVQEWQNWQDAKGTDVEPYLAPCLAISPTGYILAQRRADPLRDAELPAKLPLFMNDLKKTNMGLIGGKIVLTDYAYMNIWKPNLKLQKVKWDIDAIALPPSEKKPKPKKPEPTKNF